MFEMTNPQTHRRGIQVHARQSLLSSTLVASLLLFAVLPGCDHAPSVTPEEAPIAAEDIRAAIPEAFAGLKSPLHGNLEAIQTGNQLFHENCGACHGPGGQGGGEDLNALSSDPGIIGSPAFNKSVTDGYLFWRLSELALGVVTDMPEYPDLSESQRWQIVSYLRERAGLDLSCRRVSDEQRLVVEYRVLTDRISTSDWFDIEIRVTTRDGSPLPEDFELDVDAHMPDYAMSLGTRPVIEELGPGLYRVRGLAYPAEGHWQLEIDVKAGGKSDLVAFDMLVQ